ncbi:uncharacterized protein LOC135321723 [Camelus dromedarius]|uniref:uncharacterized protein LOC135321723 n=1 Tax=Camelus dromedarius TaxID=9838 RepID=UPI003119D83C
MTFRNLIFLDAGSVVSPRWCLLEVLLRCRDCPVCRVTWEVGLTALLWPLLSFGSLRGNTSCVCPLVPGRLVEKTEQHLRHLQRETRSTALCTVPQEDGGPCPSRAQGGVLTAVSGVLGAFHFQALRIYTQEEKLAHGYCVSEFTVQCAGGSEEVASEEWEPEEEAVEDSRSEDSEVVDMVSSEELDLFSEDEPSEGGGRGLGGPPREDLESLSSEGGASLGDLEEIIEECEGPLSEDSGPKLEALLVYPRVSREEAGLPTLCTWNKKFCY